MVFCNYRIGGFFNGLPFFLQLFFGQPRIGIYFNHDDTGGHGRVIKLRLMNIPVNNPLLKAIKVSRLPAQDVYLTVKVYNASTSEVVAEQFIPEIELSKSTKDNRVNLPSSILMANVTLVKWQRESNSAILISATKPIVLKEGKYLFLIGFGLDDKRKLINTPCLLHIGSIETEMFWDKDIVDKILT